MKQGSILVNIARGALINEAALSAALSSGHLGGAVLDVFEKEPLPQESPLWNQSNLILTPHNSFVGEHNASRLAAIINSNLSHSA